ncbi:Zinc finger MYM-type 1 [Labeo rohita]|uniref:Zinc finger MYM-type 1 n=1 Tax=Labeo rohita TaxID=84645 RepID=A0A498NUV9_LABRO|nr:Zinc finger MYM-type 1 [Labeo rohita]
MKNNDDSAEPDNVISIKIIFIYSDSTQVFNNVQNMLLLFIFLLFIDGSGLSPGLIAGIVVAILLVAASLAAVVIYYHRKIAILKKKWQHKFGVFSNPHIPCLSAAVPDPGWSPAAIVGIVTAVLSFLTAFVAGVVIYYRRKISDLKMHVGPGLSPGAKAGIVFVVLMVIAAAACDMLCFHCLFDNQGKSRLYYTSINDEDNSASQDFSTPPAAAYVYSPESEEPAPTSSNNPEATSLIVEGSGDGGGGSPVSLPAPPEPLVESGSSPCISTPLLPGDPALWGAVTEQLREEAVYRGPAAFQNRASKYPASISAATSAL